MHTLLGSKSGRYLFLACIATVVLFLTGCASAPSPLPSAELRSQLSKVRISHCTAQPEVEVTPPSGAVGGGMKGFSLGLLGGSLEGLQWLGVGAIVFGPTMAFAGLYQGVKESQSASRVEEFDKKFKASIQKILVIDILQQRVAYWINKLKVSEITAPPDQSATIIMEVVVTEINLGGGLWFGPQPLIITQKTRLIRAADGKELYNHSFGKWGKEYTFDEWFAMDTEKIEKEIQNISDDLALQVVMNLYLLNPPKEKK